MAFQNFPFQFTGLIFHTPRPLQHFKISLVFFFSFNNNTGVLKNVTVVGTRGKPRSDVNRPVPVDIISSRELQSTGQIELGQQLQFSSPSYNSAQYAINGSLVYADYATLRGLGPNQILVLVNGKRRHQFSIPPILVSQFQGEWLLQI
jgi:outer membrane receptor for ferrienterochelin and colicin